MYEVKTTNRFDKDTIRCINRKYDFSLLEKSSVCLNLMVSYLPNTKHIHLKEIISIA